MPNLLQNGTFDIPGYENARNTRVEGGKLLMLGYTQPQANLHLDPPMEAGIAHTITFDVDSIAGSFQFLMLGGGQNEGFISSPGSAQSQTITPDTQCDTLVVRATSGTTATLDNFDLQPTA